MRADYEDTSSYRQEQAEPQPEVQPAALPVRIVSDYICPWCYLGRVRIERLRQDVPLNIQMSAFDLRPGLPAEGLPREAVYGSGAELEQRALYVRELAAAEGISIGAPSLVPDTHKAHQATEFAREAGRDLEYSLAVFRAYWERDENIGDERVLLSLAAGLGLDALGLHRALQDIRYAAAVNEQIRWARWNGVAGVPTFIFNGRKALVGAQPYEVLASVARRLLSG